MIEKNSTLINSYQEKKEAIRTRLKEFENAYRWSEERLFAELSFCICTPQSKAKTCWKAISTLMNNGTLYYGDEEQIRHSLVGVRFSVNKARYIIEARNFFQKDNKLQINERIRSFKSDQVIREWLAKNVKGFGMKEASHFLRNIGLGKELAILDRHILRNLLKFEVISDIPKTLGKKTYLQIESKMKEFSNKIDIPMSDLDLLFWSEETGEIFK
jgi:N-glycosylase/DNA lyase